MSGIKHREFPRQFDPDVDRSAQEREKGKENKSSRSYNTEGD